MRVIRCPNRHFYDADKFQTCPHCSASGVAPAAQQPPVRDEYPAPVYGSPAMMSGKGMPAPQVRAEEQDAANRAQNMQGGDFGPGLIYGPPSMMGNRENPGYRQPLRVNPSAADYGEEMTSAYRAQPAEAPGYRAGSGAPQQGPSYQDSSSASAGIQGYSQNVSGNEQGASAYQQNAFGNQQGAPAYQQNASGNQQGAPAYQQNAFGNQQGAPAYQQNEPAQAPAFNAAGVAVAPAYQSGEQAQAPAYNAAGVAVAPAYDPNAAQAPAYQNSGVAMPASVGNSGNGAAQAYQQNDPIAQVFREAYQDIMAQEAGTHQSSSMPAGADMYRDMAENAAQPKKTGDESQTMRVSRQDRGIPEMDGNRPTAKKTAELLQVSTNFRYMIVKKETNIGKRASSVKNDIIIDSSIISRQHAKIYNVLDRFLIEDLGSVNKTFLNGRQLSPHRMEELKDGDTVIFGNEEFMFTVS